LSMRRRKNKNGRRIRNEEGKEEVAVIRKKTVAACLLGHLAA